MLTPDSKSCNHPYIRTKEAKAGTPRGATLSEAILLLNPDKFVGNDELRVWLRGFYGAIFSRDLSDAELQQLDEKVTRSMKKIYSRIPGFDAGRAPNLLKTKEFRLFFSPKEIFSEIARIQGKEGGRFQWVGRYQKAGELLVAAFFALALRKMGLGEWFVRSDDAPDIFLARVTTKPRHQIHQKSFDLLKIEVLYLPEIEKEKWEGSFEENLVGFIREKKFRRDYGTHVQLLIYGDFEQQNIDFTMIRNHLRGSGGPFQQIWLLVHMTPCLDSYTIIELFPGSFECTVAPRSDPRDRSLLY